MISYNKKQSLDIKGIGEDKMTYTFKEHQKNILIGIVAGLLSGVFLYLFDEWKDKGWWALLVPLFVVVIYYVIISLVTYPVAKRFSQ